jgi:hypothetical protein
MLRIGIIVACLLAAPAVGSAHHSGLGHLFRVWRPSGRPATDPADLPLTQRARETLRAYRPRADDSERRCIAPGMPAMLATSYPVEFIDAGTGEQIVMRLAEWDEKRTIYMNPRNGPPTQEPSPAGVSFGRWEDETLAIFTTYIDYPFFDGVGTPQSAAVTVLERYTPSDDGARLDWTVTVTDAATFMKPVVRSGFMAIDPGERIERDDCTVPAPPTSD